jgi:predicted transcriptional regulator
MSTKEDAKKRTETLKRLRDEHEQTVNRMQVLLREQNSMRKQIRQALEDGPKTVPEITAATQLPGEVVMWHIMAMKKYNAIAESGMSGSFYQYQLMEAK